MLPRILDDNERHAQKQRPSLPAIRDLFGEHLERPTDKTLQTTPSQRSFPLSLADLGPLLPAGSRPPSPGESSVSRPKDRTNLLLIVPKSTPSLSQPSSSRGRRPGSYLAGHRSDASAYSPSLHDHLTLPPIHQPYSNNRGVSSYPLSTGRPSSPRRPRAGHSRAHSTSEAMAASKADSPLGSASQRRHTIGSPGGRDPANSSTFPSPQTERLSMALDDSQSSLAPSPPTSGEDAPTERRKSPAKYVCQYCGKRFNRPSSLKIHYNTHTGEKPFACPFPGCGRHFSVMSNMRRHTRIHGETVSHPSRESSAEANPDMPSPAHSPTSSAHNTPSLSNATPSSPYLGSHAPSAPPSPHLHPMSHLSPSMHRGHRRNSVIWRSHPYNVSPSPTSDDDGSSLEQ